MKVTATLCVIMVVCAPRCQENTGPAKASLTDQPKENMIASIEDGRSFLEAGNTEDQDLIPPLQRYLVHAKDQPGKREALMALAKLGDPDAQQFIVCTFYGNDKNAMQDAAEEQLPYIGGWFSISLYRYLLSPEADKRFFRAKKPESSDLGFISPSAMAIIGLPKVVPNPPLRPGADFLIRGDVDHDRQVWLKWISENQPLLQKLGPVGEKVDFSGNLCKRLRQPWKNAQR